MTRGMRFALTIAAALAVGAVADATQYAGWGDTGWTHTSKRECCNDAIAIAEGYSIQTCVEMGGRPRRSYGTRRGTCRADWTQDGAGGLLYRCYGEAEVWCR